MNQLLQLFDLFNASAKMLAGYLPQSGPQLLDMLKNVLVWGREMDVWMGNTFGVSVQLFLVAIGKIIIAIAGFLFQLLQQIVGRMGG
ncbi:MAG: hypothetical protein KGI60_01000 [Patescibacteria group bacterium]|nr:hypothetical protein [Patescibacteria group bacterium]